MFFFFFHSGEHDSHPNTCSYTRSYLIIWIQHSYANKHDISEIPLFKKKKNKLVLNSSRGAESPGLSRQKSDKYGSFIGSREETS